MNSMGDFKPQINPGYTENRHDDKPEALTAEQAGLLGFVTGMAFIMIITLLFRGLGA